MGFAAVECIDEALEDTKGLLFPFDLKTWAKLAVIAMFAGGSGGFNFPNVPSGGSDIDPGTGSSDVSGFQSELGQEFNLATGAFTSSASPGSIALIGVVALFLGLGLALMYISSVFEFIYYKSLLDREVNITGNFKYNKKNGFKLFSFRLLWTLSLLTIVGIGIALVVFQPLTAIPLILLTIPLMLIGVLVSTFVNTFVILSMLESGNGFIDSAKSVYKDLRSQLGEFLVYFLLKAVLGMAVGLVVFLGALTIFVVLAIPFAIIGVLVYMVSELLVIPVIVIGLLAWLCIIMIALTAPTSTFMYYYSIEVYYSLTS